MTQKSLHISIGASHMTAVQDVFHQITNRDARCACRLPARVHALFLYLHEEKHYGTLPLLAGGLAVPLLAGDLSSEAYRSRLCLQCTCQAADISSMQMKVKCCPCRAGLLLICAMDTFAQSRRRATHVHHHMQ